MDADFFLYRSWRMNVYFLGNPCKVATFSLLCLFTFRWPLITLILLVCVSCWVSILSSYVIHSFLLCYYINRWRSVTVNLKDLRYCKKQPHPFPTFPSPKSKKPSNQVTMRVSTNPLFCMFFSPLPNSKDFFFLHFHSQAQTALALTRGHPMLSLSNYLTNHSETALISAYCSAWLQLQHRLGVFLERSGMGPNRPGRRTRESNSLAELDFRDPRDPYVSQSSLPQELFS